MTSALPMKLRGTTGALNSGTPDERLSKLADYRSILINYMRAQMLAEDWHAVSDVANDLRELDVEIRMVEDLL